MSLISVATTACTIVVVTIAKAAVIIVTVVFNTLTP